MWQAAPNVIGLYWTHYGPTGMISTASVLKENDQLVVILGDTPWRQDVPKRPFLRFTLNEILGRGLLFFPANVPAPPGAESTRKGDSDE